MKAPRSVLCFAGLMIALPLAFGQWRRFRDRGPVDERWGVPDWEVEPDFDTDVFTFARVRYSGYSRYGGRRGYRRSRGGWSTDHPQSDYNVSWRLHELTALQVHPEGAVVELDSEELFEYPFIYMLEVGSLEFTEPEIEGLKRYLLNGGFLMVDDFWGIDEWENFEYEIRRVFPDEAEYPIVDLEVSHTIFSCVFELKEKPQVPSIDDAIEGRPWGITWETNKREAETPHYRAIHDAEGNMMVLICHNTDLGDGWEREGEDHWYFKEFAEKRSYPMIINILYYAMTR